MTSEPCADHDLETAWTIPSAWYTDPAFLEKEQADVFSATWQLAGRTDQVARVGDYFTVTVAGEPVVIARGADEVVRGFFNVCQHRAGPVALDQGNRKTFICHYHGWTYNLDGTLRHAPEFEGVQRFDPCAFTLKPVRVETWGPLLFVNLDMDAPPLSAFLGDISRRAAGHRTEDMRWALRRDYEIRCNWKVYVDNYLEGYHLPVVHPGLYREIDYDAYRVDTFRYYSIQHAPIRGDESKGYRGVRRYKPEKDDPADAQYYWVFPNLMLNIYLGQMQTNLIVPLGHDRTLTIFEWYFLDPDTPAMKKRIDNLVSFGEEIQQEDIFICEHVQQGLHSRAYDRGRYSVKRENGVHHFHRLLGGFLEKN
jgi:choline monooxygenase